MAFPFSMFLCTVYHAGSIYGWSEEFSFHTPPQGENWAVRAAIYGDMGNKNAHVSGSATYSSLMTVF